MAKTHKELVEMEPDEFARYYMNGFDPAAPEGDKTVVIQRWQKQIIGTTSGLNPLYQQLTRFPATGKVHTWPPLATGGPIPMPDPPPYGTVLRPTRGNRGYPHSTRMMVIGPTPLDPDIGTLMITLNTAKTEGYAITNETLWTEWEVPD